MSSIKGWERGTDPNPLEDDTEKPVIFLRKTPLLVLFHTEGLDDPIAGDGLMKKRGDQSHPLLTFPAEFTKPFSKFFNGDDCQGKDEEGEDRPFPISVEDDPCKADQSEGVFQQACHDIRNRRLDEVHIVGDSGDQDSGGGSSEERQREVLEMIVKLLP